MLKMRTFISLSAALLVAVLAFAACHSMDGSGKGSSVAGTANTSTAPASQSTVVEGDGVRRVTPAEAREAFDAGNAVIVDTRAEEAYKSEHIKGSINIPLAQIDAHLGDLPHNKMIITYCT